MKKCSYNCHQLDKGTKRPQYKLVSDQFGVHQRIITLVKPKIKILEIGCASGYLSEQLTKKGCIISGIEINPREAEKATRFCQEVVVGDVESPATLKKIKETFDLIILADVLEHLRDPESVLGRLLKFLNEEGRVIISVPNIAFLTNRLLLLKGQFDYTEWGVMDKTHLRFFTRDSITTLIKRCGLEIEKFDYIANFTQLPLFMQTLYPIFGNRGWWRKLEYKIAGFWTEGLAVQFLILCRGK